MAQPPAKVAPILLILNGPDPPSVVEKGESVLGHFDVLVAEALEKSVTFAATGVKADLSKMVRVYDGEPLPGNPAADYAAVILSGSLYNVTETERPWLGPLKQWLCDIHGTLPVFGICFGHQILAVALGGEVSFLPTGKWGAGSVMCTMSDAAKSDACFGELAQRCPQIAINVANSQGATKLPDGAVSLGSNAADPNLFLRFGPMTYSTQFHPEFSAKVIRELCELYPDWPTHEEPQETQESREILGTFVAFAAKRFADKQ
jgi:GMP synthase-like glutamine amidotransferase